MMHYLGRAMSCLIREIFIFLIVGLRPLLGPPANCRYAFSCTDYAVFQLENEPFFKAIWNISKRLLSCHPFHK